MFDMCVLISFSDKFVKHIFSIHYFVFITECPITLIFLIDIYFIYILSS